MQEEACRHTLSALHTMLRHAVHRALFGAHSTIVCLTVSQNNCTQVNHLRRDSRNRPFASCACTTSMDIAAKSAIAFH